MNYLQSLNDSTDTVTAPPVKAVYIDWRDVDWNKPDVTLKAAVDAGFNVIFLAFYLLTGATDFAQAWASLPAADRLASMQYAHSKGAVVLLTVAGSTVSPYYLNATSYATTISRYALAFNYDGVDYDLENLEWGCTYDGKSAGQVVTWLSTLTTTTRSLLGPLRLITHSPQAPYFGTSANPFTGNRANACYTALHAATAPAVNWFNVQFYNQGETCYLSYKTLFTASDTWQCIAGTAVSELVRAGLPLSRLVVGKPISEDAAGGGYVTASALRDMLVTADQQGLAPAGVSTWDWQEAYGAHWIATVYPSQP